MRGGAATAGSAENGSGRRWSPGKAAAWAAPALIMLLALINNRFTDEEGWSAGDFVFAGGVLYGALGAYELLVARMPGNSAYRAGFGVGLVALVLLLWGNGASGITDTDVDGAYLVVLAVGVVGAFAAQFRPAGMARAMFATASAMALVSGIALVAGMVGPNNSVFQILGITGFYVALFAGSAMLFREAVRAEPARAGQEHLEDRAGWGGTDHARRT